MAGIAQGRMLEWLRGPLIEPSQGIKECKALREKTGWEKKEKSDLKSPRV